jgi:dimethylargininase
MTGRSCRFTHAIAREPADSAVAGLRAVDTGAPDIAAFRADHAAYVAALRAAGVAVTVLPPLPAFPDSVFVEDTALCLPEAAIVLRPGAPSRFGEAAEMAPHLAARYGDAVVTLAEGFVEGGDLLMAEGEILAGRSARTDAAGIAALAAAVAPLGWRVRALATPPGVLHFKTDCSLMDETTILATDRLAATGAFAGYRVIRVAEGEEAAANAIRVNDRVLFPAGFPRTRDRLLAAGYAVTEIGNAEAAKLDGGMSCLSLRFTPPAGRAG